MPERLRLVSEPPVLEQVVISIPHHSADTVTVKYDTIVRNHPQDNKNKVMLWVGKEVDWTSTPESIQLVENNDANGTFTMENLRLKSKEYTVGYSVTGEVMGICASALVKGTLPIEELLLAPTSVKLTLRSLDKTKLVIDYATLRGYNPKSAGNWMGLWRGDIDPFKTYAPVLVCLPEDDVNEGRATFLTEFREQSTYTVGYFMADKENQTTNKTAAALFRFDTA
ncbi:MAG: hypothetical protein ABSF28_09710 [Terracidiphilus sp.]